MPLLPDLSLYDQRMGQCGRLLLRDLSCMRSECVSTPSLETLSSASVGVDVGEQRMGSTLTPILLQEPSCLNSNGIQRPLQDTSCVVDDLPSPVSELGIFRRGTLPSWSDWTAQPPISRHVALLPCTADSGWEEMNLGAGPGRSLPGVRRLFILRVRRSDVAMHARIV